MHSLVVLKYLSNVKFQAELRQSSRRHCRVRRSWQDFGGGRRAGQKVEILLQQVPVQHYVKVVGENRYLCTATRVVHCHFGEVHRGQLADAGIVAVRMPVTGAGIESSISLTPLLA